MSYTEQTKNTATFTGLNKSSASWGEISLSTSLSGKILIETSDALLQESSDCLLIEDASSAGPTWTNITKN